MTRAEYEARMRRLTEDHESARVALNNARALFDRIGDEMRDLRITYREQLTAEGGAR